MKLMLRLLLIAGPWAGLSAVVHADPEIQPWKHAEEVARTEQPATDYLLGLGALQKIRGLWRHKASETITGDLQRVTWKANSGFTSEEGYDFLRGQLSQQGELLFECTGRQCGSSAQWASRVFEERLLYGHDDRQRYSAWRFIDEDATWSIVLYASDRANRRHYLHMDVLRHLNSS